MTTGIAQITNPKDLLDRSLPITVGDFVTIYDEADYCKVGLVTSINGNMATICKLSITAEEDDIYIEDQDIAMQNLVFLDDSFVSVDGVLWQLRNYIRSSELESKIKIELSI